MDDVSSTDRGPRQADNESQTGTGTPRSADVGTAEGALPSATDELDINRSGSGGSGGPQTPEEDSEGSTGQSMNELLEGQPEEDPR
jgi:hypothetical protein